MADGFLFPVVVFTLIAGVAVICLIYITKLVKSVAKDNKSDAEEIEKSSETTVKKPAKSGKKKNVERRGAKQNYSHPWLMTSLKGHTGQITDMDFSPNGKYLATCAEDRTVFIWTTKDWIEKDHRNIRINVEYDFGKLIRWSPDSKAFLLCKANSNELQAYRLAKKNHLLTGATKAFTYPKVHKNELVGLGIASNGKFIVTCSGKTDLIVSDVKGAILSTVDTYLNETYCAGVTPCGRFVYASGFTPDAKFWEVQFNKNGEFNKIIRAFELGGHSSGILRIAFNATSTRVVTVSKDGSWRLYNIQVEWEKGEDPKLIQTGKLPSTAQATAIALSPTGDVIAVAIDGCLLLYFADTAELDMTLKDVYNGEPISQVLFDASSQYVLTSGEKHVRVFHNVTGHKAAAALASAKLHQPGLSAATKERLSLQLETAEALISSLA